MIRLEGGAIRLVGLVAAERLVIEQRVDLQVPAAVTIHWHVTRIIFNDQPEPRRNDVTDIELRRCIVDGDSNALIGINKSRENTAVPVSLDPRGELGE